MFFPSKFCFFFVILVSGIVWTGILLFSWSNGLFSTYYSVSYSMTMEHWRNYPIFGSFEMMANHIELGTNRSLAEKRNRDVIPIKPHMELHCKVTNLISPQMEKNDSKLITLVTHSSIRYLDHFETLARHWDGPISVGLFLTSIETKSKLLAARNILQKMQKCSPEIAEKLSVHAFFARTPNASCPSEFVYSDSKIQTASYISGQNGTVDPEFAECSTSRLLPGLESEEDREELYLKYAINGGRNVAKLEARTELILVADVELVPSPAFHDRFAEFYEQHAQKRNVSREAFVVPVFEIAQGLDYPNSKNQLTQRVKTRQAVFFHQRYLHRCHVIPGEQTWLETNPGDTASVHVVAEYQNYCWEPVFIISRDSPHYDEQFYGFGLDKTAHVYELCLMGYRFPVMDGIWLAHSGIRRNGDRPHAKFVAGHRNNAYWRNTFRKKVFRKHLNESVKHSKICGRP